MEDHLRRRRRSLAEVIPTTETDLSLVLQFGNREKGRILIYAAMAVLLIAMAYFATFSAFFAVLAFAVAAMLAFTPIERHLTFDKAARELSIRQYTLIGVDISEWPFSAVTEFDLIPAGKRLRGRLFVFRVQGKRQNIRISGTVFYGSAIPKLERLANRLRVLVGLSAIS